MGAGDACRQRLLTVVTTDPTHKGGLRVDPPYSPPNSNDSLSMGPQQVPLVSDIPTSTLSTTPLCFFERGSLLNPVIEGV